MNTTSARDQNSPYSPSAREYPKFKGIQFGFCSLSAAAEYYIKKDRSILVAIKTITGSASIEHRWHINDSFISARVSTKLNFGLGVGLNSEQYIFTPQFGVYVNLHDQIIKPHISIGINL